MFGTSFLGVFFFFLPLLGVRGSGIFFHALVQFKHHAPSRKCPLTPTLLSETIPGRYRRFQFPCPVFRAQASGSHFFTRRGCYAPRRKLTRAHTRTRRPSVRIGFPAEKPVNCHFPDTAPASDSVGPNESPKTEKSSGLYFLLLRIPTESEKRVRLVQDTSKDLHVYLGWLNKLRLH